MKELWKTVEVFNKSVLPTSYVRILAQFVAKKLDVPVRNYQVHVEDKKYGWSGYGNLWRQHVFIQRHFGRERGSWPYRTADSRYVGSRVREFLSRTEVLVFVMGHELGHAIFNSLSKGQAPKRGRDTEFLCDEKGLEAVKAYREARVELWSRINKAVRREHALAVRKATTKERRRAEKSDPAYKLGVVSDHLFRWESRLQYAQHKVRDYRRRVKYYEKRVAATRST
jgi:hypothetical protein